MRQIFRHLMSPILHLNNVHKHYPNQEAATLRGISFDVNPGEFVALMGPSGCGKSTLLNIIGALDTVTSGHVIFQDLDLASQNDETLTRFRRTSFGFVFQFFNLLNTLTVSENIALPLEILGQASSDAIQKSVNGWLDEVHLQHRKHAYPSEISGGEMQRTAIARALIHKPAVLLADEPTGNLDSENGQQILSLLKRLCETHGQAVIMATHSEEAARQFAHRVIYIRDGQLADKHSS